MKAVGIIAEYNPFHNGHAYQLSMARNICGADYVIAAMSGSFVQRGEPAMFARKMRAKWALENGADMVVYLPVPFSLSSAEAFAMGGVSILSGTGIIDALAFGSECGDADFLSQAAKIISREPAELKNAIQEKLASGLSYPDARARALSAVFGREYGDLLDSSNDILGIEYIKAIDYMGSPMTPIAVKRKGTCHDSSACHDGFASASEIRRIILHGSTDSLKELLPCTVYKDITELIKCGRAPITLSSLSEETVYALRRMTKAQLSRLPDVSEGLENLIFSGCRKSSDMGGVLEAVKSRRYTLARLKRICMCALLGIYGDPKKRLASSYIHIAGLTKRGIPLLSAMKDKAALPVVVRWADIEKLSDEQRRLFELDTLSCEIASLGAPCPPPVMSEFSQPLMVI